MENILKMKYKSNHATFRFSFALEVKSHLLTVASGEASVHPPLPGHLRPYYSLCSGHTGLLSVSGALPIQLLARAFAQTAPPVSSAFVPVPTSILCIICSSSFFRSQLKSHHLKSPPTSLCDLKSVTLLLFLTV